MKGARPLATARQLVLAAEKRFKRAKLYFGHGTDNARDEAVFLVFHALGLPFDCDEQALDVERKPEEIAIAEALVQRRIKERRPAAYLTQRMWFAGLEFYVDENVLIPRSPIAELLNTRCAPFVRPEQVRRILDIGTGSACIAIAAALAFPNACVDATDISPAALAVARKNVTRHGLASRLTLHETDLYPPGDAVFDLILANPPYVPQDEMDELPPEFRHEPRIALYAPDDGLALLRQIFMRAGGHLARHGVLLFDAGGTWPKVDAAFPELDVLWLEMRHGGDGIGLIEQAQLRRFALQ